MAYVNPIFAALSACGFESSGAVCFGVWDGYAVALQLYSGKSYFVRTAIRTDQKVAALRKGLQISLKSKAPKGCAVNAVTAQAAVFTLAFGKTAEAPARFSAAMDAITAALRENGLSPADTCALTGAARPDSLCLVRTGPFDSFQPVSAAAVRALDEKNRESLDQNEMNGSYALGFVGALLGMLVGLIPNLLTIIFAERIFGILFALVPLASMFGYKLMRGKMSKGSVAIVVALSLLGVVLIPFFELTYYFVHDYGAAFGEALSTAGQLMLMPEVLSELAGELLQLLLFMALGIWIAWRYISGQTNRSLRLDSERQMATLRPNPARETHLEV